MIFTSMRPHGEETKYIKGKVKMSENSEGDDLTKKPDEQRGLNEEQLSRLKIVDQQLNDSREGCHFRRKKKNNHHAQKSKTTS